MMSKIKILIIAAALLAFGIIIYPQPPRVDGNALVRKVLRARHVVSYKAVQENTTVLLGRKIRSTISVSNESHPVTTSNDLELLILCNYIPMVEGHDRIAGRNAWVLRLKPRLKHMPWKQIWVDKQKFVVLASRDWTAYNVIKRSMKTVSISFEHNKALRMCELSEPAMISTCNIPKPSYIPRGFVLIGTDHGNFVYSDGLYSITIIKTHDNSHYPKNKALDWGQGMIYSTGRFTVIADLPADMIERVAHSITP